MAKSGLPAGIFSLCLLAAGLSASELSLQNNGRFGPVSDDPAVRLVEEQLVVELGKTSSTVRVTSRFVHQEGRSVVFNLLYPDLAQGWENFAEDQARLAPEKRVKWTDPDNPFYLFPFSALRNPARIGGDFSGRLSDVEITIDGKPIPSRAVMMRVKVSSDTTWGFLKQGGFPMAWQKAPARTGPDGSVTVERRLRTQNTVYLGGSEVNFFDYEVLAGRGDSPDTFSVTLRLRDGLTVDHLKWQGLNQTDTRHMVPGPDVWNKIDPTTLRLFWSHPYRHPGRNLLRLAWDHEWVNAPEGGRPVHSGALRFVRFLPTPKGAPAELEVSREYFFQNFRVVIYPTAVVSDQDRKTLRRRKIKPGAPLEIQGVRTAPDEISVKDGSTFKIK